MAYSRLVVQPNSPCKSGTLWCYTR